MDFPALLTLTLTAGGETLFGMTTKPTITPPAVIYEALRELIRPIVLEILEEVATQDAADHKLTAPPTESPTERDEPPIVNKRRSMAPPATPDGTLNIYEVSARTGHSPDRIRHLRVKGHELYSLAWKNGDAQGSRLLFDEHAVDAWVKSQRMKSTRPESSRYE